ncbi:hypothetical protein [Mycolicibacterium smegmatis]|uniref:Uncharacterized protein n=1 Tax=Mycolicibacterium smegmatis (strain MKD8) TaxID=1214915 RepID=A0A2U9PKH9_MYCSE|nr:hypothetical protein [Mycolicibacterium smegmatis]AWT52260.1 hypothetical protein D806_012720 [Mycolicibacterium smegmatis MKD8]
MQKAARNTAGFFNVLAQIGVSLFVAGEYACPTLGNSTVALALDVSGGVTPQDMRDFADEPCARVESAEFREGAVNLRVDLELTDVLAFRQGPQHVGYFSDARDQLLAIVDHLRELVSFLAQLVDERPREVPAR